MVENGKVYELGLMYYQEMPRVGKRTYELNLPETGGPYFGESSMLAHGEKISGDLAQIGAQFDGLGHIGKRITSEDGEHMDVFYNGFTAEEIYAPDGLKKLGVENVKSIITRGILIDLAGAKSQRTLPDGYLVTMEEVYDALRKQQINEADIQPGDALLFNFGWSHHLSEPDRYKSSSKVPGLNHEVAQWIIEKRACMIGSDCAAEKYGKSSHYSVHFDLLMMNGIHNLEFMNFEPLLEDRVYTFLFIFTPLPLKGATGSPGRPIAIR